MAYYQKVDDELGALKHWELSADAYAAGAPVESTCSGLNGKPCGALHEDVRLKFGSSLYATCAPGFNQTSMRGTSHRTAHDVQFDCYGADELHYSMANTAGGRDGADTTHQFSCYRAWADEDIDIDTLLRLN